MMTTGEDTIIEVVKCRAQQLPHNTACYHRDRNRNWQSTDWMQLNHEVTVLAQYLARLGICKGERTGIFADTCRQWQVLELAIWMAGGIAVCIDPNSTPTALAHTLRLTEPAFVFADTPERAESIESLDVTQIQQVLTFADCDAGLSASESVEELPQNSPDDAAIIILTSGTTGDAKGIQYSHRQLMASCNAIANAFPNHGEGDRIICWLPMAHLFQQAMNLVSFKTGISIYFADNPREIMDYIREVSPTIFIGVPRLYEKLYEGLQEKLTALPSLLQKLINMSLHCGATKPAGMLSRMTYWLNDAIVLRTIRKIMGGKIKFMITGSAPMPVHILEFFHSIGLLLLEAYGISENTVPIACNRPDDYRFGSVGKVLDENTLRFSPEGVAYVNGPGVFSGYLGKHESETTESDGSHCTGDCGHFDSDGFLYLTGRKADIIKTSTGRKIAPTKVEAALVKSSLISQAVVTGNGRKHLAALIVPAIISCERKLIEAEVEDINQELSHYEQVRSFVIMDKPFSVAEGEITPSLKYRRSFIEQKHKDEINKLYTEEAKKAKKSKPSLVGTNP